MHLETHDRAEQADQDHKGTVSELRQQLRDSYESWADTVEGPGGQDTLIDQRQDQSPSERPDR